MLSNKKQYALIEYLSSVIMKAIEDRANKEKSVNKQEDKKEKVDDICAAMAEIKGRKYWSMLHYRQANNFNEIVKKLNLTISAESENQQLNQAGDLVLPSLGSFDGRHILLADSGYQNISYNSSPRFFSPSNSTPSISQEDICYTPTYSTSR